MKKRKIIIGILGCLSLVATVLTVLNIYATNKPKSEPANIIGGSEGPATIVLTSNLWNWVSIYTVTIFLIVLTFIAMISLRQKNKEV